MYRFSANLLICTYGKNRRFLRGFTILELMIVVIIVGVLASLAIPKFGMMIERSRATEAIVNLNAVRTGMERCYVIEQSYSSCFGHFHFSHIGMDDPSNSPNSHFTYGSGSASSGGYTMLAVRNTYELLVSDPGGTLSCGSSVSSGTSSMIALCAYPEAVSIRGVGLYEGINTTPH